MGGILDFFASIEDAVSGAAVSTRKTLLDPITEAVVPKEVRKIAAKQEDMISSAAVSVRKGLGDPETRRDIAAGATMAAGVVTGNPALVSAGAAMYGGGKPVDRIKQAALGYIGGTVLNAGAAAYAGYASAPAEASILSKLGSAAGAAGSVISGSSVSTAAKAYLAAGAIEAASSIQMPKPPQPNMAVNKAPVAEPLDTVLKPPIEQSKTEVKAELSKKRRSFQRRTGAIGEPPMAFRPYTQTLLGA